MPKFENSWGNLLVAQKLLQYNKRKSLSNYITILTYINKHIKFIHFGLFLYSGLQFENINFGKTQGQNY